MDTKRQQFTCAESQRLVELVLESVDLLKGGDRKANVAARREERWQVIANTLNSENLEGGTRRSVADCKKHWQYKQGLAKRHNVAVKRYVP